MSGGDVLKQYSLDEVSRHADVKGRDIWIVISNKVYDVSKFLDEHPGGEEVLFEEAGRVATGNFEDIGHSTDARTLMNDFLVGELTDEDKLGPEDGKILDWGGDLKSVSGTGWTWINATILVAMAYFVFKLIF